MRTMGISRLAALLVAASIGGCGGCGARGPKGPPPEYEEPVEETEAGTTAATATASATATATPSTTASVTPTAAPLDPAFLPISDDCKKDADCGMSTLVMAKDVTYQCCAGCNATAGTKAWVSKVEKLCAQKVKAGLKQICPPWDCAAPSGVACVSGKCQVKP
jgi:hypothetical protein